MKKIYFVLLISSSLLSCQDNSLIEKGVLEKCRITSVEDITTHDHGHTKRSNSYSVKYTLNSDSTHQVYKVDCHAKFMYSNTENYKYKDKIFDVVLLKDDPSTNQILLAPDDYEHFHKELPDSMAWIINYIKDWNRTSHGLLNY